MDGVYSAAKPAQFQFGYPGKSLAQQFSQGVFGGNKTTATTTIKKLVNLYQHKTSI